METLKKHKEFIEGMKLGNCPNPDNQKLIEVVEAAKTIGITETWVCTCEPSFNKWVNELYDYCLSNNWFEPKEVDLIKTEWDFKNGQNKVPNDHPQFEDLHTYGVAYKYRDSGERVDPNNIRVSLSGKFFYKEDWSK